MHDSIDNLMRWVLGCIAPNMTYAHTWTLSEQKATECVKSIGVLNSTITAVPLFHVPQLQTLQLIRFIHCICCLDWLLTCFFFLLRPQSPNADQSCLSDKMNESKQKYEVWAQHLPKNDQSNKNENNKHCCTDSFIVSTKQMSYFTKEMFINIKNILDAISF